MRHLLVTALIAIGSAALPGAAVAATSPHDDFLDACNKRSGGNVTMCTCKADFAVKTLDPRMLGYVIAAMASNKTDFPKDVLDRWGVYVSQSNRLCAPGN